MADLITTTTIFSPKTFKKTFTKVNFNNANFGEFMRIFLKKCEANRQTFYAKRSEANSLRIRNFSQFCEFAMGIWIPGALQTEEGNKGELDFHNGRL